MTFQDVYFPNIGSAAILSDEQVQFLKVTVREPFMAEKYKVQCEYCQIIQPVGNGRCNSCGAPLKIGGYWYDYS